MPLVGVHCTLGDVPLEQHEQCMRDHDVPPCAITQTVLNVITRPNLERVKEQVIFSPSSISGCHRQHSLKQEFSWYMDVNKQYKAARGTIFHKGLSTEGPAPGTLGAIRELRMHATLETKYGPQRFSGQLDEIILKNIEETADGKRVLHVRITDFKTKDDIAHSLIEADRKHVYQVNNYAWLAGAALAPYLAGWWTDTGDTRYIDHVFMAADHPETTGAQFWQDIDAVVTDVVSVAYLSMGKSRTFTSGGFLYTEGKMLGAYDAEGRWHRLYPPQFEELELSPIPLFKLPYTESIIRRGIEEQIEATEELAAPLTDELDARMMCTGCPVKLKCVTLGRQQGYDMRLQAPYVKGLIES